MDPSAAELGQPQQTQHHDISLHPPNDVAVEHIRQFRNKRGWRKVVVNLTPAWFSVTMGMLRTSIYSTAYATPTKWKAHANLLLVIQSNYTYYFMPLPRF